ncbi:ABC-type antimicrobial peptide transport system, permease component [Desulfosporosinus orientis DSM 765]|uniref:ABC-type antimicrobial peptide transport system, permease component n=1 Tax=Desulfosporosinus orientis (strain ATCC 19365 / DSM 765 / NCIMB 8382 / VKM B-1628 / Singapore I) TaxID=768706 RepID=G7W9U7_DESOD|nr:ABC transporter permease [Desulfosporosinus orientis]AET70663.1 ABC-type antimicrobial peptide transport system, permease component [Desulfosporosinus orientis DSM 765]
MNFFESIRVSLRALRANKLRSALTMLGIIIGVAAVIAMVGIGNGATASITSQIQGMGSNLITISPGQANSGGVRGGAGSLDSLTMTDVDKIAEGNSLKAVAPIASTNAQVVLGSGNTSASITGTTEGYEIIKNVTMARGRFITEQDVNSSARVAVLGPNVVESLLGDANADIVGKKIKINNVPFQVIGVTTSTGSTGFQSSDDMITAPISTVQGRLIGRKTLRSIMVSAKSEDLMQTAQDEITATLRKTHKIQDGQDDDFRVQNQADMLETMQSVTQTLTMLLGGIAGISLLVGGIGIMNIMLVSVTERTREIGIRKAIGAKSMDILLQFLIEAVVLSILGGGIGIALGYAGSSLAGKALSMQTSISMTSVVMAFGFSAGIGIIFGVFPARKAATMDPIDALRFE